MHSAASFSSSDRTDGHGLGHRRPSHRHSVSSNYSISVLAAAIAGGGKLSPTIAKRLQPKSHGMLTGDTE